MDSHDGSSKYCYAYFFFAFFINNVIYSFLSVLLFFSKLSLFHYLRFIVLMEVLPLKFGLRMRIDLGVTVTSSSSTTHAMHSSNV